MTYEMSYFCHEPVGFEHKTQQYAVHNMRKIKDYDCGIFGSSKTLNVEIAES